MGRVSQSHFTYRASAYFAGEDDEASLLRLAPVAPRHHRPRRVDRPWRHRARRPDRRHRRRDRRGCGRDQGRAGLQPSSRACRPSSCGCASSRRSRGASRRWRGGTGTTTGCVPPCPTSAPCRPKPSWTSTAHSGAQWRLRVKTFSELPRCQHAIAGMPKMWTHPLEQVNEPTPECSSFPQARSAPAGNQPKLDGSDCGSALRL